MLRKMSYALAKSGDKQNKTCVYEPQQFSQIVIPSSRINIILYHDDTCDLQPAEEHLHI